ncbi:sensor histidine kinase [Paenibacillus sp. GCM10027626]|uniref:sensor histidine kinase n=1 Tax=Paenibacillus sp. GCM10027626 TaxID=3273411 RepID=UPI0036392321
MNVLRRWRHWSVGAKVLALLFAVVLLSSVLLFQTTSWLTQKAVREFMYNYVIVNQEKAQTGFEFLIGEINMLSVRLLTKNEIYRAMKDEKASEEEREAEIRHLLEDMSINRDVVWHVAIVTEEGRYFEYGNEHIVERPDPLFIEQIKQSNTPVWGDIRKDETGDASLMLGRKYYNFYTGERIGYLVVYIRERALYEVYKNMVSANWGDAMLLANGRYVLSAPDPLLSGTTIYDSQLFEVGQEGYKLIKLEGRPVIIFNYQLTGDVQKNRLDWRIVSIISQEELFKQLQHIKRYSYILQLLLITGGFMVAWYMANRIVNPVNRLARTIRKYREGGSGDVLDPRAYRHNHDEIALLETSFSDMVIRIEELIGRINEDKDRQRETELIALQAQINPHFLYNTLDAIGWIAKLNSQKEIEKMIVALASFYRLSLHKGDKSITVREEIGIIRSYETLEQMRFPGKFSMVYQVEDDMLDEAVLKIILQPLVENAIKHGISQKRGHGNVWIHGYREGQDLVFEIRDDGIGFDPDMLHRPTTANKEYKGGGYGIRNVDERIKLEYGAEYGVNIDSRLGEGTTVVVRLRSTSNARLKN